MGSTSSRVHKNILSCLPCHSNSVDGPGHIKLWEHHHDEHKVPGTRSQATHGMVIGSEIGKGDVSGFSSLKKVMSPEAVCV